MLQGKRSEGEKKKKSRVVGKSHWLFGRHWIHMNSLELRDRRSHSPFQKLQAAKSSEKKIRDVSVWERTDQEGMLNCAVTSNGGTKGNSAVISVTNEISATDRKQSTGHLDNILISNTIKVQQSFQYWEVVRKEGMDNTKYLRKF